MTSFYLKYRPQTVADLDLRSVREFFERLVKSGKVHHAYLFAGPRGTGKTSAARILAKIVNCEGKSSPCDKCDNCLAIKRGNFSDLIEIDAASNRGIDDVRTLRESVGLAPLRGRRKVYLIDEVHMLTPEAGNALLKTLEEPPETAMFILATTQADKLPETVVSRCTVVNFNRGTVTEVVSSLAKIVKGERLQIDKAALEKIAAVTEGSFRDAQKLLEQIAVGREQQKITVDLVTQVGAGQLLEYLLAKDRIKALAEIGTLEKQGVNWKNIVLELVEKLRPDVLAGDSEKKVLLEKLVKAGSEIKDAPIPQLPLELAIVEWCFEENRNFDDLKNQDIKKSKTQDLSSKKSSFKESRGLTFGQVQAKWPEVLAALKPKNHSLAGLLRSSRPTGVEGDKLMIEVFYQFHLDQLRQERYRAMIEEVLQQMFAFPLKLEYSLGEKKPIGATDIAAVAEEVFSV